MKTTLKVLAFFLTLSAAVGAQVMPQATGPTGPLANGRLYYAFRYGQTAAFGGALGTWQTSNISGTLDYANRKVRAPFSIEYGGGYTWTLTGPSYGSGVFQRVFLSQGAVWREWSLNFSDDASYLPQTPFTGFSGIPGIGEPIGIPNPTPVTTQSILSLNTHAVNNIAAGTLQHLITSATTLDVTGNYDLLRFPNNDGLNSDTYTANGMLTQRLDARNSIYGNYLYSLYSYPDYSVSFKTQTGLIGFRRLVSREFTADIAAGPVWLNSSETSVVPNSLSFAVNARVDYFSKPVAINVTYNHGFNNGGGYLFGAASDTLQGTFSRTVGTTLTIGLTGAFDYTGGLINNGATNGVVGGGQATWQFARNFIAYANYTGTYQTSTSPLPANALNQVVHFIGFGVGFSPREVNRGQ